MHYTDAVEAHALVYVRDWLMLSIHTQLTRVRRFNSRAVTKLMCRREDWLMYKRQHVMSEAGIQGTIMSNDDFGQLIPFNGVWLIWSWTAIPFLDTHATLSPVCAPLAWSHWCSICIIPGREPHSQLLSSFLLRQWPSLHQTLCQSPHWFKHCYFYYIVLLLLTCCTWIPTSDITCCCI